MMNNINKMVNQKVFILPKALLYEDKYKPNKTIGSKGLSNDAKLLYGILLDIYKNNNFVDDNGDRFIIFDNIAIAEILNVATKKAVYVKRELIKFGLLREVRQGLGKANRLYLNVINADKDNEYYEMEFQQNIDYRKTIENERLKKYRNTHNKTQIDEVLKYFNYKCAYTGIDLKHNFHIDHIIPISKGGSNNIYNLVPTIPEANLSKSNRELEEWYREQDYFSEDRLNKIYKYIEHMKTNI